MLINYVSFCDNLCKRNNIEHYTSSIEDVTYNLIRNIQSSGMNNACMSNWQLPSHSPTRANLTHATGTISPQNKTLVSSETVDYPSPPPLPPPLLQPLPALIPPLESKNSSGKRCNTYTSYCIGVFT